MGSLGERPHFGPKLWGNWVRCKFWSFSENCSSPAEATYIEFLTLKREIVHRIIWNNQFAVEIKKSLALTDQKKKEGVIEWTPSIFSKDMGSLGDSGAVNGGLNSPTYVAPPKWECPLPPGQRERIREGRWGKIVRSDLQCLLMEHIYAYREKEDVYTPDRRI